MRRRMFFLDLALSAPSRLRRPALLPNCSDARHTHSLGHLLPAAAPMQRPAADPSHLITPMTPEGHAVGLLVCT
jgi:hypothetical protein